MLVHCTWDAEREERKQETGMTFENLAYFHGRSPPQSLQDPQLCMKIAVNSILKPEITEKMPPGLFF